MDGSLDVQSAGLGHGSCFHPHTPCRLQHIQDMNMNSEPSAPINHRILVIDDNPAIHEDFRKVLNPPDSPLEEELMTILLQFSGEEPGFKCVAIRDRFRFPSRRLESADRRACTGMPYGSRLWMCGCLRVGIASRPSPTSGRNMPDLQYVICTAYSVFRWDDRQAIGNQMTCSC